MVCPLLPREPQSAVAASRPMRMSAADDSFVPDMSRRQAMNLILFSSLGVNVLGLAVPYIAFFVPPGSGDSSGGVVAHDAIGNDVTTSSWLATHAAGSRELAEGIKVPGVCGLSSSFRSMLWVVLLSSFDETPCRSTIVPNLPCFPHALKSSHTRYPVRYGQRRTISRLSTVGLSSCTW